MATTSVQNYAPIHGSRTDEGYVKKPNEDTFDLFKIGSGQWEHAPGDAVYVGIVADGVTSKAGGEQASRIATETIKKTLQRHAPSHLATHSHQLIGEAIHIANREILEVARQNPEWGNMSTTLVLAAIAGDQLSIAHLGDSRAYLLREGTLYRLTLDHTWIQEALDLDRITAEEARAHPNRNVIRRYLGINPNIEVDWQVIAPNENTTKASAREYSTAITLLPDDLILLCSDGLTEKVSDEEILGILNRHKGAPDQAANLLVKRALAKKEQDNITVVLFSYAKRSTLAKWGKWLWIPLMLLLGVFLYTLYSGLGARLSAEDTAVDTVVETTVDNAVAALPAVTDIDAATIAPTAIPPTQTPMSTVVPLAATSDLTSMIGTDGEAGRQPVPVADIKVDDSQTVSDTTSTLNVTPTKVQTSKPTPTREIPSTPTATPPLPTATAVESTPARGNVAPTQSFSGAAATGKAVTLLEPQSSSGAGPINFRWQANFALADSEAFELIFWKKGEVPLVSGQGFGGTSNLPDKIVDCGPVVQCDFGRVYCWGVLLVEMPYERKAFLGPNQCQEFRFESSGGSGNNSSCTLRNSDGKCID